MKQHIKTVKEYIDQRAELWSGHTDKLGEALDEVVKAAERYELVRTLTVMQFKMLCQNNIYEDERFDDLVDKMIAERTQRL
jgi:hypothetical protein